MNDRASTSTRDRVVVIGAGVGGLSAAIDLARRGLEVVVLERAAVAGGKLAEGVVGGRALDVGPTVLTMPWVFERLFDDARASFRDRVSLRATDVLARHRWSDGAQLDLHADRDRSAAAVERFAGGREAERWLAFSRYAERIYRAVEEPFMTAQRPGALDLLTQPLRRLADLPHIDAHRTMDAALRSFFRDRRLVQLYGRYATYVGSSPMSAPATLNVIAHVEAQGVYLVEGGMVTLARELVRLLEELGGVLRTGVEVASIRVEGSRVKGVTLAGGERIDASAVIMNGDPAALAGGRFGADVARATRNLRPKERSLSAVTLSLLAEVRGVTLGRHAVFFADDPYREWIDLFRDRRLPEQPSVYVNAQDRGEPGPPPSPGPERLFLILNAPARGETPALDLEIRRCAEAALLHLSRSGLELRLAAPPRIETPHDFARRFPESAGALYGAATHGALAPMLRPGARTSLPGLFLAGGAVHPGAGVPMAALSGRRAAERVLSSWPSIARSRAAVTAGGTSTPWPTTAAPRSP